MGVPAVGAMMAAMDGVGNGGHVLEVVIAAPSVAGAHAVSLAEDLPGTALAIREEGRLVIDVAALMGCATPRAYGRALGEALWQGSTLGAWQRARARGRERLHVVHVVLAPELRALRWERLCAPFDTDWDFLRCDQRPGLRGAGRAAGAGAGHEPERPRGLRAGELRHAGDVVPALGRGRGARDVEDAAGHGGDAGARARGAA